MPTPSVSSTAPGYFAHGSPGTGVPYTVLSSDWANSVQEEILAVVQAAGLTPSKADNAQLLAAIRATQRIKLTAPLTLYVATTGNDANNGLTTGTAVRTLQQAANIVCFRYDQQGYVVTVHVADGTYNTGVAINGYSLTAPISFIGNSASPTSCKIALSATGSCFQAGLGAVIYIDGFAMEAGPGGTTWLPWVGIGLGINAFDGGYVTFQNVAFGPTNYAHIGSGGASSVSTTASGSTYSIYGGAHIHMAGSVGGQIGIPNAAVSFSANAAFDVFALATSAATIFAPYVSYTLNGHTVTGTRYQVDTGAGIGTGGGGASYFPGSIAGVSGTGGVYT